ncbi:MAG: hypothetical protein CSA18_05070 [Deltaproteobacteria bacterium]|nr:MAG: hypothetical protein CSA18_05070 [Deltaproteobacteria bacterium]
MKTIIVYIILGSILISCIFGDTLAGNIVNIPVYPSAEKVETYIDKDISVHSKYYVLSNDINISDLISFYSIELEKLDFLKVENNLSKKGWTKFIDVNNGKELHICQLSKEWLSRNEAKRAILLLEYKSYDIKKLHSELFVTIQIMPNINELLLDRFYKEIKDSGELEKFMKLLAKYETSDGNIDFDKAISENPENSYLQRYKEILHDAYP